MAKNLLPPTGMHKRTNVDGLSTPFVDGSFLNGAKTLPVAIIRNAPLDLVIIFWEPTICNLEPNVPPMRWPNHPARVQHFHIERIPWIHIGQMRRVIGAPPMDMKKDRPTRPTLWNSHLVGRTVNSPLK